MAVIRVQEAAVRPVARGGEQCEHEEGTVYALVRGVLVIDSKSWDEGGGDEGFYHGRWKK